MKTLELVMHLELMKLDLHKHHHPVGINMFKVNNRMA